MKHRTFIILLFVIYMVAMTGLMIWQGIGIAPDRYAFVLLLGSLLVKRTRNFILDWIPFLFLLISYDFLRGLADQLATKVNFTPMINFDKTLFGELPSTTLQRLFFNPYQLAFHDYFFTVIYFLHFALPLSFGFLLWLQNRQQFREFVTAISTLSYAAWATFILFPAAPPWLAQKEGYITGITKIMDKTIALFPTKIDLPTIYHNINPNPVAAVPSLHTAYPLIVFLFAWKAFKLKALFFLPYVLAVWTSIVYLGEHYVADVLAGIVYAITFYLVTVKIIHYFNWGKLFRKLFNISIKNLLKHILLAK